MKIIGMDLYNEYYNFVVIELLIEYQMIIINLIIYYDLSVS